jgi:acyl-CoA synthetase (AMP-forming)/AMP-acid ligase II
MIAECPYVVDLLRKMKDAGAEQPNYVSPPFGFRLLPHVIDERANTNHERPFASVPKSLKIEDGFEDISYRALSNAINRCAHWLVQTMGRPPGTEVVAYIAAPDLRYQILAIAAVKVGYVVCTLAHSIRYSILLIDTRRCSFPHLAIPWRLLSLC